MNPPRWILLPVAGLFLLGAGGVAWRIGADWTASGNRGGSGTPAAGHSASLPGKARDTQRRGRMSFANLPRHLQQFVSEVGELARDLNDQEELTAVEFEEARAATTILVAALGPEELRLLIDYYDSAGGQIEGHEEAHTLVDVPLFRRWGELAPAAAHEFAQRDLRDGIALLETPTNFFDPFGRAPGRRLGLEQVAAIYFGVATRDPRAALASWREMHDYLAAEPMVEDAPFIERQVLHQIGEAWAITDPRGAWAHLKSEAESIPERLLTGFFHGLEPEAPWDHLAAELSSSESEPVNAQLHRFAGEWARNDPERALAWMHEHQPDRTPEFFRSWFGNDYRDQGFDWLQENHAALRTEHRLAALGAALEYRDDRLEELTPLLRALPSEQSTWDFAVQAAATYAADPFGTRDAAYLQNLLEHLAAPPEVLEAVQAKLAWRDPASDNADPFGTLEVQLDESDE